MALRDGKVDRRFLSA